jgi:FixJ family two-component response regulator
VKTADNKRIHVFCDADGPVCGSQQSRIRPRGYVLIMAGGDVPTAVRAIKAGRADLLQKSMQRRTLVSRARAMPQGRVSALTYGKRRIFGLGMNGEGSTEIGDPLKRWKRTVEFHRAHLTRRFGANGVLELAKSVYGPPFSARQKGCYSALRWARREAG